MAGSAIFQIEGLPRFKAIGNKIYRTDRPRRNRRIRESLRGGYFLSHPVDDMGFCGQRQSPPQTDTPEQQQQQQHSDRLPTVRWTLSGISGVGTNRITHALSGELKEPIAAGKFVRIHLPLCILATPP